MRRRFPRWLPVNLFPWLIAPLWIGCADEPHTTQRTDNLEQESSPGAAESPFDCAGEVVSETWDVHYLGTAKVGHLHGTTARIGQSGDATIRRTADNRLSIRRAGQMVTQEVRIVSLCNDNNQLRAYRTVMESGPTPVVASGQVENDQISITIDTNGQVSRQSVEWDKTWGGPFAIEQSLQTEPLKPGEQREMSYLEAVVNQPVSVTLSAGAVEETSLLSSRVRLLKITAVTDLGPNGKLETILWTDKHGKVLKSELPAMGLVSYRTTKEVALDESDLGQIDLMTDMLVKLDRALENPHRTRRAVYQLTLQNSDVADMLPLGVSQRLEGVDGRTARLVVTAVRPEVPQQVPAWVRQGDALPSDADRSPNSFIQSDDPEILALANQVQAKTPWEVAVGLERQVHQFVKLKDFSQAFATAADVIKHKEGDCTEHAVLLAALCRAKGIPARVAMGLVYYPPVGGFAYHMWTEAWINDRWVPLDATLAHGGIGAAHIKVGHSNLSGVGAYATLLPVFRVLGQLEIRLVDAEY